MPGGLLIKQDCASPVKRVQGKPGGLAEGATAFDGTYTGLMDGESIPRPFPFYLHGELGANGDFFNRLHAPENRGLDAEDLLEYPYRSRLLYYFNKVAKTPKNSELTTSQRSSEKSSQKCSLSAAVSFPKWKTFNSSSTIQNSAISDNGNFPKQQETRYLNPPCGEFLAVGECSHGHVFGKQVYCGREWCLNCRQQVHLRRIARWLPKAQQMATIGYLVITFPLELRPLLRDKRVLASVGRKAAQALRDLGYSRGLRRWHFFGDKSKVYNPHLNILIDAAYLPKTPDGAKSKCGELDFLINFLRKRLIPASVRSQLEYPQDIHYSYHHSPAQIYHKLRYITRATFLDYQWDRELALGLRGFRNTAWWGQWHDAPVWSVNQVEHGELAALVHLVNKVCPVCQSLLHWHMPKGSGQYFAWHNAIYLSGGYWELYQWRPPPGKKLLVENRNIIN